MHPDILQYTACSVGTQLFNLTAEHPDQHGAHVEIQLQGKQTSGQASIAWPCVHLMQTWSTCVPSR